MKKTIRNSNKYFKNDELRRELIVDAVYSSSKIEGSNTTKEELFKYYDSINKD